MLPNKDENLEIDRAIKDNGITDPRAKAQMIRDFGAGKYAPSEIDSYAVLLKDELAKPATGGDGLGEHADLVEQAYTGKGNADARSRLVTAVGKAAADDYAKKFGLSGVGDFSRAGVAGDDVKLPTKANTNPWSPKYAGKAPAEGERIRLIKALGTKAATEMARSAGTDIAGRPLRAA